MGGSGRPATSTSFFRRPRPCPMRVTHKQQSRLPRDRDRFVGWPVLGLIRVSALNRLAGTTTRSARPPRVVTQTRSAPNAMSVGCPPGIRIGSPTARPSVGSTRRPPSAVLTQTVPAPCTTPLAAGPTTIALPGLPDSGSTRVTVPSALLVTQIALAPKVTPAALWPTGIGRPTISPAGLTRSWSDSVPVNASTASATPNTSRLAAVIERSRRLIARTRGWARRPDRFGPVASVGAPVGHPVASCPTCSRRPRPGSLVGSSPSCFPVRDLIERYHEALDISAPPDITERQPVPAREGSQRFREVARAWHLRTSPRPGQGSQQHCSRAPTRFRPSHSRPGSPNAGALGSPAPPTIPVRQSRSGHHREPTARLMTSMKSAPSATRSMSMNTYPSPKRAVKAS